MSDPETVWRTHYVHPGAWDVTYPPLTLPQMFDASVAAHGAAILTDFLGARLSYARIGAMADRFAATLIGWGVAKGDRVGLYLPNVPDYLIAYYGALKAGAVVVNMSPLYSRTELAHQTADSGARIVVTTDVPAMFDTARALLDEGAIDRLVVGNLSGWLPLVKRWLFRRFRAAEVSPIPTGDSRIVRMADIVAGQGAVTPVAVAPEDIALIQYTGGTTGTPKGAMLTHANMTANARQVHALDPHPDLPDRILGVLPFFHVFANTCVLNRTVLSGGMIAMLPRFGAKDALRTIQRVKATALPGVPTMYQALLDHPDCARTDFSSLRVCISGAAPLAETLKAKFEAVTGSKVVEGYGLTESAGVVATNPYEGVNKGGTIGQPVPGTRVLLVDRDDPTRPAPDAEPGELVVLGPQVMAGYWGQGEREGDFVMTRAGRALRTGDVATIDSEGYIRIVDRLKDMIAVGGFKVFPSQIEEVLYRHEAVKEAIVIGIPDNYHGEMPKAFVTLNDGYEVEGDALKNWLNPQLGKHERVAAVEVRADLPKTLVGKLSRKELVAEERVKAAA
ncbi:AMP-binding protein [Sphingomonas sp. SUN039]|uniref:AMP-binding protein n=1 Tax=Sphingomonas sp. SUN039 TaxID=2937787 RepID=UPI00216413BB|nr:AMP-binding protein [Sphingomonas sp. SUN039]UVO54637.1 AMP-binding protein [Sphingomonas sp. SUN039]